MKLYATVTSERASKGQGGNDYLDIEILVGSRDDSRLLARLTVRPNERGYGLYDHTDELLFEITDKELKGEKQKGDNSLQLADIVTGKRKLFE